jgi:hypothetical protein
MIEVLADWVELIARATIRLMSHVMLVISDVLGTLSRVVLRRMGLSWVVDKYNMFLSEAAEEMNRVHATKFWRPSTKRFFDILYSRETFRVFSKNINIIIEQFCADYPEVAEFPQANKTQCYMHLLDQFKDTPTYVYLMEALKTREQWDEATQRAYDKLMTLTAQFPHMAEHLFSAFKTSVPQAFPVIKWGPVPPPHGPGLSDSGFSAYLSRAWARLMHSINGNRKTSATIKIQKTMKQDTKILEDDASRQFWRFARRPLEHWDCVRGLKPEVCVKNIFDELQKAHRTLPKAISAQIGRNRLKRIATETVKQAFKVDNGKWVCRACNQEGCPYDPEHVSSDHPASDIPYNGRNGPAMKPPTQPPPGKSTKPVAASSNDPGPPPDPEKVPDPETIEIKKNGKTKRVPVVANAEALLDQLMMCRSRPALLECVRCDENTDERYVIACLASLISTLKNKSGHHVNLKRDHTEAIDLIGMSENVPIRADCLLPRLSEITADDVQMMTNNTLEQEFRDQIQRMKVTRHMDNERKLSCAYCHKMHTGLCLPMMAERSGEPWTCVPQFKTLMASLGDFRHQKRIEGDNFMQFEAWVPAGDRAEWWISRTLRVAPVVKTFIHDRNLHCVVRPTGARFDVNLDRVDEDLDRSLDPSCHLDPQLIEVEIDHSRFGVHSTRRTWISQELYKMLLYRNNRTMGRAGDTAQFVRSMERYCMTSDNIRIPTHLTFRFPSLIQDTQLVALYRHYSLKDCLDFTLNSSAVTTNLSSTVTVGSGGKTCLNIGLLILLFVLFLVVAGRSAAGRAGSPPDSRWEQASTYSAQTEQTQDLKSTTSWKQYVEPPTEQEVKHLHQMPDIFASYEEPRGS